MTRVRRSFSTTHCGNSGFRPWCGSGGSTPDRPKRPARGTPFLLAPSRELEQRQANQVQRRLREARFPLLKTLETTDLKKWPVLDAVQVRDYAECGYITRHENVVLLGKHGTGKTHRHGVGCGSLPEGLPRRVHHGRRAGQHLDRVAEERQLKRRLAKLARFELRIDGQVRLVSRSAGASISVRSFHYGSLMPSNLPTRRPASR